MVILFAVTLFLSSSLLFIVQPMIAKMVLPLLGGTPAVWNTCMVFFQTTLLVGYLYAHASTRWLRFKYQAALHIVLLAASFLALPIVVVSQHSEPPTSGTPVAWLLRVLLVTVGIPFFLVSSSGPLLQRWFSRTDHPLARDPYFLSVAGNLGSIVALLAYPVLLEPSLRLNEQSSMWTVGYVALMLLTTFCFFFVYRQSKVHHSVHTTETAEAVDANVESPSWKLRLHWIALAFVPSSLLLGVTTFLTTDVAAVPLFWIVPLVIYLMTFVLVFARRTLLSHAAMIRALPFWVLPLAWLIAFSTKLPVVIQAPIHVLAFFFAAMVCHGELARRRPDGRYLTEFYLSMSVGGVLGGLFNALVAPVAFSTVLEYPLALVFACALRSRQSTQSDTPRARQLDFALPVVVGGFAIAMMFLFNASGSKGPATLLLAFIVPTVACYSFSRRPVRFALTLGALMLAGGTYSAAEAESTYRGRSFFGVHRVFDLPERNLRYLVHGGIIHGAQHLDAGHRREPSTYFHRTGPIGQVFAAFHGKPDRNRVAVIGLGIGTLAAYSEPGQQWTFFEIDPAIVDLARDPRRFTFLSDSPAQTRVVLGDARIALTKEPPRAFDLLIVDAFSSDAIPVHLLTREALQLYLEKLDTGGVLAFHISNSYLSLTPLIADLARDAGLVCLAQTDAQIDATAAALAKSASQWAVLARSPETLGPLAHDKRWRIAQGRANAVTWTDDFSNPLSLISWFGN
ncbi:MAG TPA: fused MFS/spermidine synthase [Vicinamibacterales bacterium]|nr:fused MFS/spermidine synthase [Vicinamibacterales bacterium]